jgi:hypothetical protein
LSAVFCTAAEENFNVRGAAEDIENSPRLQYKIPRTIKSVTRGIYIAFFVNGI